MTSPQRSQARTGLFAPFSVSIRKPLLEANATSNGYFIIASQLSGLAGKRDVLKPAIGLRHDLQNRIPKQALKNPVLGHSSRYERRELNTRTPRHASFPRRDISKPL
jgi:hypothetical protein